MRKILVAAFALAIASPALAQSPTVQCDGAICGGTGVTSCVPGPAGADPRMYAYPVTDPNGNITDVEVGTDDCNINNYTNWCTPAGWIVTIDRYPVPHDPGFTVHGVVSPGPAGNCPCVIHWNDNGVGGGLPAGTFIFGFNSKQDPHDVGWRVTDGVGLTTEVWTAPVGVGVGPVHGPKVDIPTVSEWGLVVMTLLVLSAGTLVIFRRRTVTA